MENAIEFVESRLSKTQRNLIKKILGDLPFSVAESGTAEREIPYFPPLFFSPAGKNRNGMNRAEICVPVESIGKCEILPHGRIIEYVGGTIGYFPKQGDFPHALYEKDGNLACHRKVGRCGVENRIELSSVFRLFI